MAGKRLLGVVTGVCLCRPAGRPRLHAQSACLHRQACRLAAIRSGEPAEPTARAAMSVSFIRSTCARGKMRGRCRGPASVVGRAPPLHPALSIPSINHVRRAVKRTNRDSAGGSAKVARAASAASLASAGRLLHDTPREQAPTRRDRGVPRVSSGRSCHGEEHQNHGQETLAQARPVFKPKPY